MFIYIINHQFIQSILTKLLIFGILFAAAVKAVLVAKLVMLVISPLTCFTFVLRAAVVAKLVILCNSHLATFILALTDTLVPKLVLSGI